MRTTHRLAAATVGLATLFAGLAAPSAAFAEDVSAASSQCQVTGGTLTWGVKEAFRSYISGSIAKGEWVASDGATYQTPRFTFTGATGSIDANTGEGLVSFTGTVVFTGHAGVLNLQFANPSVRLRGDGAADLLLDAKSNDAEGELVVDAAQVPTARIDGIGAIAPASGAVAFDAAPTVLTADGVKSFAGFYATGEALDPISLSVTLGPCVATAPVVVPGEPTEPAKPGDEIMTIQANPDAGSQVPWLPIGIAAGALVVIGVAIGLLLSGRRRTEPGSVDANGATTQGEHDPGA